jgi:UDP-N-acetylglucosamine--N-acetylmuramyl-(pentapeptide) pyrophosphoryl-undecaprenol N-acetylglucosamine transferase
LDDKRSRAPTTARRCRVLLVGGGTAGHVSPLLAVAEVLARLADVELLFIGGRRGLEGELARKAGIRFHAMPLPSLRDPDSRLAFIGQALLLPLATLSAVVRIARFRPAVCVTSGSFSALPALFAARLLRVPIYLWVGDAIPGRALRAAAGWSARIGVTFAPALATLPRGRASVTGNPIRGSLLRWTKAAGRDALGLPAGVPVVFVTGGSQGSEKINTAVSGALKRLLRRAAVVHHTGPAHLARAEAQRELVDPADRGRYQPRGYFHDDMGAALAAADLVVGRAGSSSIAEPLAFGTPLVLIPFGASMSGHQSANARAAAETGAATILPESDLDGDRLAAVVNGLLDDGPRLARMAAAAKAAGRPDAAEAIARDVLALGRCGP